MSINILVGGVYIISYSIYIISYNIYIVSYTIVWLALPTSVHKHTHDERNQSWHPLTHWGRDKMAAVSTDETFQSIFLNENVRISIKISLKFVPKGQIRNVPALDQIMFWRWPGDNPLSERVMVGLATHICVTRPQNGHHITDDFF